MTGPVFRIFDVSFVLYLAAAAGLLLFRRVAAVIALVAALLALPMYLYFVAPGPFRALTGGVYSVHVAANFVWNTWCVAGITPVAVTSFECLRSLKKPHAP